MLVESEIEQGTTIEDCMILLLCEFEQWMVRLERNNKRPIWSLHCLSDMVNRVAEVSEKEMNMDPKGGFMARVLGEVSATYSQMQLLHSEGNRLSVRTAVNLYNDWAGDRRECHEVFHQICIGVIEVMEAFFSLSVRSFRSRAMRDQWREAYDIFTGDLKMRVDKIQF